MRREEGEGGRRRPDPEKEEGVELRFRGERGEGGRNSSDARRILPTSPEPTIVEHSSGG
jgi:hypothetical protein